MYTVSCKASYGKKSKLIKFVRKTITAHSTRPHLMELMWALYTVSCYLFSVLQVQGLLLHTVQLNGEVYGV